MARFRLEDDSKEKITLLIRERIPWLILGLCGGILATFIVSRFENILSRNISLAFFLPVIVYMSDAIGTQTENVYVRNLAKFKDNFFKYLFKEMLVGICFGLIFGLLLGLFVKIWLGSDYVALTVATAMFIDGSLAPVVALIVPELLFKEHTDPALGAGPFTTIIQNLISLSVYLIVAVLIIF
ncbi:MAG: hypothetical protein G01um10147_745 [Microgenomates group bacterium Gr01-1014_7]|nr:MAG: hypothetical protein G01um10147_745 [Microgenomates group bacterium Gr01-1014_7]